MPERKKTSAKKGPAKHAKKAGKKTVKKAGEKAADRAAVSSPKPSSEAPAPPKTGSGRPSALLDTRVVYCGDCLEKLRDLPDGCVDLIYIDPPFNSNRNYEVFWGETKEKRAFEDRHASTQAYIDYMRPRCVELARVLKKTGSFYYHCDWHASHYVKVMLDQTFGENNFVNEIIWQRTNSRSEKEQWPRLHDTILLFVGGARYTYHPQYRLGDEAKVPHTLVKSADGHKYNTKDLTGPGITKDGESGRSWRGFNPTSFGRHWVTLTRSWMSGTRQAEFIGLSPRVRRVASQGCWMTSRSYRPLVEFSWEASGRT